jgi:hypothetical protein
MVGDVLMTADFDAVLAELYQTFEAPRPGEIAGCPCCIDTKEICTLTSKALRDVSDRELAPYAASVFLTVEGNDFGYFLPRIFELAATVSGWWPSPEVAIGKLRRANWDEWPTSKKEAVRNFLRAWLERHLALGADDAYEVDSIFCGIGLSGDDLSPYLDQLAQHPEALQAYAELNAEALARGELANAFWQEAPERAAPIVRVLTKLH